MKIVCPFTPDKLNEATVEALTRWAPHAVMVDVSGNNESYAALLESLWDERSAFAIVEHDIEIHEHVVVDFTDCREPWCANEYHVGEALLTSLGCVRFRPELMEAEPDAVVAHRALGPGGVPARDWRRLDMRLHGVLHERGYWPCVHQPPVTHHHEYPPVQR